MFEQYGNTVCSVPRIGQSFPRPAGAALSARASRPEDRFTPSARHRRRKAPLALCRAVGHASTDFRVRSFMQRRCPDCASGDVRRSHPGDLDEPATTLLRSRYYCRKCSKLFWVLSARTYRTAGIVFGIVLALLLAVALSVATAG